MKRLISICILGLLVACGTVPPAATQNQNIREQSIGAVILTYTEDGDWVKMVSSGTAPINDRSPHAVSEASKVALLHAKQNIAEFMSDDFSSDKHIKTNSVSTVHSKSGNDQSENDMTTVTEVAETMRANSNSILRGVQVTNQTLTESFVKVEVTVTKQSVAGAMAVQQSMQGLSK